MIAPININEPEPGHYWMRLVRGGPKVPVRIWYGVTPDPHFPDNEQDRGARLQCLVGDIAMPATLIGRDLDAWEVWTWCADHPIDEPEYTYLLKSSRWDAANEPNAAQGKPLTAIDMNKTPPVF